ncbi:hypothetical protein HZS_6853 [Henneguya salminicola]|nr:hypothetical protein HZS_6853 [Henneguya salminicola]
MFECNRYFRNKSTNFTIYENIARIQNLCSYLVEGIIMVVDVESECSFLYIKDVKKEISKIKNKEVPMVILYDTSLQPQEKPTFYKEISTWAETEKIKIFDTQLDSNSNIFEAFKYLIAKMTSKNIIFSFKLKVRKDNMPF